MSLPFSPDAPRLVVPATVTGPRGTQTCRLALDTRSELTVLPANLLRRIGCDFSHPVGHARLRSTVGLLTVPLVRVPMVTALEQVKTDFVVAIHELPSGAETDGQLGLDFLRGFVLTIDFARGRIMLAPRRWWQFWR